MSCPTDIPLATLQEYLADARAALHALLCGRAYAMFTDQNGESVRYTQANSASLRAYIADLESQIAAITGCGKPRGPARIVF